MRMVIVLALALAAASVSTSSSANEIYITQSGNGLSLTVDQKGENNSIKGLPSGDAVISGTNNSIAINQGYEGNNLIRMSIDGNNNDIEVNQERGWGGYDTNSYGYHYAGVEIDGSGNSVEIEQRNNNDSTTGHSSSVRFRGNDNTAVTLQTGSGSTNGHLISIYTHDTEANNSVDVFQNSSTADHRAYVSMYNDGNNIDIDQTGTAQNNAYVIFSGYSTDFTLTQNGGDTYGNPSGSSANINCGNIAGCTVTVNQ